MQQRTRVQTGIGLGLLLTALFVAANALIEKIFGVPVLPFVLFDWLTTTLPGGIVTFGLDRTIDVVRAVNIGRTADVAKNAERLLAFVVFMGLGGLLGAVWGRWRWKADRRTSLIVTAALMLPTIGLILWLPHEEAPRILSLIWFGIAWYAWARGLAVLMGTMDILPRSFDDPAADIAKTGLMTRRIFLTNVGFRLGGLAVAGFGARFLLDGLIIENARAGLELPQRTRRRLFPMREADDFIPAPGTRPELSTPEAFYVIDKNLLAPNVDAETWTLTVDGAVANPQTFLYDEILALDNAVEFHATLTCISNEVGGDLIGNTLWVGVPLRHFLDAAGLNSDVVEIKFHCADGYYETLPVRDALREETVLCYGMDGRALTVKHGFPVRLYTPGRYGIKNPKWIQRIEAITARENGYWADRGWSRDGFIQMTAVVDPVEGRIEDGMLPIGGIAFSGERGISRVEVRVDDGAWIEVETRGGLSPLTWVQWRAVVPYAFDGESHALIARCVDGEGNPQVAAQRGSRPDGATGYHVRYIR